jgi:biopolymer transport protein ExbD
MKFPRKAKIFRGQLDPVPFAGVFFLFVMFVFLSSLIYTPGILVQLQDESEDGELASAKRIAVAPGGEITYDERTYSAGQLEGLRAELKQLPAGQWLVVEAGVDAPREVLVELRNMARALDLQIRMPGLPIQLPEAENLAGTMNPTVVVVVSFGGQLFFQNQIVSEEQLKERLKAAVRASSRPPILLVRADRSVEHEVIVRLEVLALEAGIAEVLRATHPRRQQHRANLIQP